MGSMSECFVSIMGLAKSYINQQVILTIILFTKFCGTLHSYLTQNTDIKQPDSPEALRKFYEEDLPMEFLLSHEDLIEGDKFDYLIVDEAQDLITPYYLEVFNSILKGGIKNGKWVMFGDFSNQAIYLNNPKDSIQLLNLESNFTTFPPLNINCRNTKEIANQNTLMTGTQLPHLCPKII